MSEQDIQYLHDETSDFELVLCNNSVISYPLHNHVSVFTIGLMFQGSILLTQNNKTVVYRPNQSFMILPYESHIIEALEPYSLLTICVKKNAIFQNDISYITKEVFNLLHKSGLQTNEIQIKQLLRHIKVLNTSLIPSISEAYIESVKNQIECSPERKISLDEMAQSAFTSKYHFIRNFKRIVGLSPTAYKMSCQSLKTD